MEQVERYINWEEEKEKNKKGKEAQEKKREETGEDEDDLSLEELRNIILKIPGCSEVSVGDVGEWTLSFKF